MTAEDIRNTRFAQVRKGYNTEDVDDFLLQIASEVERLQTELEMARLEGDGVADRMQEALTEAIAAKEDAEAKMYILAEKVEEYRGMEDTLKTALINAQRMGETVVHEAKQKAEQMLREATGQSELLRQKAEREIVRERATLEDILGEVNRFKTTILNLYKQHIESLSALDAPNTRAEEVLEETKKYKDIEILPPGGEEPIQSAAQPEAPPIPDAAPPEAEGPPAAGFYENAALLTEEPEA
ncbi:DivIVA domain-containing protein [Ruminococcaceae bacterium OttesenSCG-928-O06]|nr:DivIVA domain-containing protein [Ruminococcaceae bacterium OttesenSCG-928-O06]